MQKSVHETTSRPTKVLRFFNYAIVISALKSQLQTLENEHSILSGNQEIPGYSRESIKSSTKTLGSVGTKRLNFIDQDVLIEQLRKNIEILKASLSTLKAQQIESQNADKPIDSTDKLIVSSSGSEIANPSTSTHTTSDQEETDNSQLSEHSDETLNPAFHKEVYCSCSGSFHSHKQVTSFLSCDNSGHHRKVSRATDEVSILLKISDNFKINILVLSESKNFDERANYLTKRENDIKIFLFDLSSESSAEGSAQVASRRIEYARKYVKTVCAIGVYFKNSYDTKAKEIFQRFLRTNAVQHSIICQHSDKGQQEFKSFIRSLTSKLSPSVQKIHTEQREVKNQGKCTLL